MINATTRIRRRRSPLLSGCIVALLAWTLLTFGAFAQPPTGMPGPHPEADGRLIDAFLDMCLTRFPDEAAFAAGVTRRQLQPMTVDGVKRYLHNDPGRGWSGVMWSSPYVVTIEDPPYHACSVRQYLHPTQTFLAAYQRAVAKWAAHNKLGTLQTAPPIQQTQNGIAINAVMQFVPGPNGNPTQTFIYVFTDYTNGQTEVRLVHQFPPS